MVSLLAEGGYAGNADCLQKSTMLSQRSMTLQADVAQMDPYHDS
jgi:hypothetical protein